MSARLFDDGPEPEPEPEEELEAEVPADAPLAERMRPRSVEEVVGQKRLLSEGGLLRRVLGDREALRCALVTPQAQSHSALLQKAQHTVLRELTPRAPLCGHPSARRVERSLMAAERCILIDLARVRITG